MPRSKADKDRIDKEIRACLQAADLKQLKHLFNTDTLKGNEEYALDLSFSGGSFTAIQAFCILSNPANVKAQDFERFNFYDKPPLYLGTKINYPYTKDTCKNIITYLLSQGVSLDDREAIFGQTALSTAIGFDNTMVALALIEVICEKKKFRLLNAQSIEERDSEYSSTPLVLSIQKGNKAVFKALLATEKVDVNKPDKHGLTPLHWAVIMGLPDMVEKLVLQGANTQALAANGKTPFDYIKTDDFEKDFEERMHVEQGLAAPISCSTMDKGLRAITAHFNAGASYFLQVRKKKMNVRSSDRSPRAFMRVRKALRVVRPKEAVDSASSRRLDKPIGAPPARAGRPAPIRLSSAPPVSDHPPSAQAPAPPASAQSPIRKDVQRPKAPPLPETVLTSSIMSINALKKSIKANRYIVLRDTSQRRKIEFGILTGESEPPVNANIQRGPGGLSFSVQEMSIEVRDILCKLAVENSKPLTVFTVPEGPHNEAVGKALSKAINKKYKDADKKPTIEGWKPSARRRPRA